MGQAHWGHNYINFDYNEIPVLAQEYDPIKQFQISALWAIWRVWSEYFFDRDTDLRKVDDPNVKVKWLKEAVKLMHYEYVKRIYELAAISQWLTIAKRRGEIREKQFLLIEMHKVDTNPATISEGSEIPEEMLDWIGKEYLVKVDRFYHRPRLKITHAVWTEVINSLGGEVPLGPPPLGPDYAS